MSGDDKPLQGKVALVTGAARNLPAVIARELAAGGAAVAVNNITAEGELRKVAHAIQEEGGRATVVMADVCRRNQLEERDGGPGEKRCGDHRYPGQRRWPLCPGAVSGTA